MFQTVFGFKVVVDREIWIYAWIASNASKVCQICNVHLEKQQSELLSYSKMSFTPILLAVVNLKVKCRITKYLHFRSTIYFSITDKFLHPLSFFLLSFLAAGRYHLLYYRPFYIQAYKIGNCSNTMKRFVIYFNNFA